MKSVLIRYTSRKYAKPYLDGNISLSSLSSYWDIYKGKINYKDFEDGKVTPAELQEAVKYQKMNQQDFSEGIAYEFPSGAVTKVSSHLTNHIVSSIRCRIEAYGYCKLGCFFRVDYDDISTPFFADAQNLAYIAKQCGMDITSKEISKNSCLVNEIRKKCIPLNPLLSPSKCHVVQLPDEKMDEFGDTVILVKDEVEFCERIKKAVRREGGDCIIGDVQYNDIIDIYKLHNKHHATVISYPKGESDGLFDIKSIISGLPSVIQYGCLDKYKTFSSQNEWRICWLPEKHDFDRKELHLGDLRDIIEIIPTKQIRKRLLSLYPGYIPGFIETNRVNRCGTLSYKDFKRKVENIDGKCRLIFDIG